MVQAGAGGHQSALLQKAGHHKLVEHLQQPLLVKLVHPPADDLHFTQRDITGMYFHTLSHRLALAHNLQANEEHGGGGGQLVLPVLTAGSGTEKMRLLHTYNI